MKIKYICTINFPKKGESSSVFSLPSGLVKNKKLNINFFEPDETELLFPWFEVLNRQFKINISRTNSVVIEAEKLSLVGESFFDFTKENNIDKKIIKKISSILKKANKNSSPVEISCWYASEFQHFITVPNDKDTCKKISEGNNSSLNCKDWILHEDQVEFLLDSIFDEINELLGLHIDLYEEEMIPSEKICDCLKLLQKKMPVLKKDMEKEAWVEIEEAFKYAKSANMPIYLFF